MTEDEIRRRVEAIDEVADMPGRAHLEEDRLYCEVLQAIAAGAVNAASLARAALETRNLAIERTYFD